MKKTYIFFILFFFLFSNFISAESEKKQRNDILNYGLDSEISSLLDVLVSEKDTNYNKQIQKLFLETKNAVIREKIISYYTETKNLEIKDYAISVLEDPFEEKDSTVDLIFDYVKKLDIKEATTPIIQLLQNENEKYIISCLDTLGEIGDSSEAVFLADYLNRPISLNEKQALVKALGKIKATETWQTLADLVQDDSENTFTRMYAAEAIGNMKKEESIPILTKLFENSDPNLRIYAIKGLSNFNSKESQSVIIQGFRDSYLKVRSESADASEKQKIKDAVPYLLYRAKYDPELSVKLSCYKALTAFPQNDVLDFYKEVFNSEKASDVLRINAAKALIKIDFSSSYPIIKKWLLNSLKENKAKSLRYELTKLLVDKESLALKEYCEACLNSSDVIMQHFGVDIYSKNHFIGLDAKLKEFASNDKNGSLQKKAKKVLGIVNE